MEDSRNQSIGVEDSRNGDLYKPRARLRRPKFSTINARLDPDFDAKESAHQDSKPQIVSKTSEGTQNIEELNPKTISFDELVKLLHPNFVTDYLQKVLHFLKSDNTEICFPNIAPYKEAFLVKIAENTSNLLFVNVNEISRVVATQILEILEAKNDVFSWTYKYESGRVAKNVLVYKKFYHRDSKNTPASNFKVPSSPKPMMTSLTASMEDLSINKERQGIPMSFKTEMLNTTLKFIKDDTRFSLQYPIMSVPKAEFIYSLLHAPSSHRIEQNVGFGFKSLYAPLVEAMRKYEADYEFKVSFVDAYSDEMTQVLLQKIPKATRDDDGLPKKRLWSNTDLNSSTESTDKNARLTKPAQDLISKRRSIDGVNEAFRLDTLRSFTNLVGDKEVDTLEFSKISQAQSNFIECIPTLARRKDYYFMLSEQCQSLLRKIARFYQDADWTLHRELGKFDKRTRLRTLIFYKVPDFENRSKNSSKTSPKKENKMDSDWRCAVDPGVMRRPISQGKSDPPKTLPNKLQRNNSPSSAQPIQNTVNTDVGVNKTLVKDARNNLPLAESTAFQSAGADDLDTTKMTFDRENFPNKDDNMKNIYDNKNIADNKNIGDNSNIKNINDNQNVNLKLPPRKTRLLQAMSTPVESDKAERMMRLMGWAGGALGLRGGITEPILPALYISSGAGLGHVKQVQTQETQQYFRQLLFDTVLSFLRSGESETTIVVETPLGKKKRSFIKAALDAFNCRQALELSIKIEKDLYKNILAELKRLPDTVLEYQISEHYKEIKLILVHGTPMTKGNKKKKKREIQEQNANATSKSSNYEVNMEVDLNREVGTAKSDRALAYRVLFLKQIKQFLEFEPAEREYKFDCVLNKKFKAFIESVVTNINNNNKNKVKFGTDIESALFEEIRDIAKDCFLTVKIELQKYTLKKRYHQKRLTDFALDLPPPKSKDISNTVIYINGRQVSVDPYSEEGFSPIDLLSMDKAYATSEEIKKNRAQNDEWFDEKIDGAVNSSVENVKNESQDDIGRFDNEVSVAHFSDEDIDVIDVKEGDSNIEITVQDNDIIKNDWESVKSVESGEVRVKETDSSDLSVKFSNSAYSYAFNPDLGLTIDLCNTKSSNDESITKNVLAKAKCLVSEIKDTLDCDGSNSKYLPVDISNESVLLVVEDDNVRSKEHDLDLNQNIKDLKLLADHAESIIPLDESSQTVKVNYNLYDKVEADMSVDLNFENDLNYLSGKSLWTDYDITDSCTKKCKVDKKIVLSINSTDFDEKISVEAVRELHDLISNAIDDCHDSLPQLECHGVINDGLVYTCYNEKSTNWLKNLIDNADLKLKLTEIHLKAKSIKLEMKMYTFDSLEKIFNRLELYNKNLNVRNWVVEEQYTYMDFIFVIMLVDNESYEYIRKAGFSLFAGVDKAHFSVLWD